MPKSLPKYIEILNTRHSKYRAGIFGYRAGVLLYNVGLVQCSGEGDEEVEEEGVNNEGLILSMSQRRKDDEGGLPCHWRGRLAL